MGPHIRIRRRCCCRSARLGSFKAVLYVVAQFLEHGSPLFFEESATLTVSQFCAECQPGNSSLLDGQDPRGSAPPRRAIFRRTAKAVTTLVRSAVAHERSIRHSEVRSLRVSWLALDIGLWFFTERFGRRPRPALSSGRRPYQPWLRPCSLALCRQQDIPHPMKAELAKASEKAAINTSLHDMSGLTRGVVIFL